MATKKYLSLERLTEYDALIKASIIQGDESALETAKSYTDTQIASIPSVDAYTKTEIDNYEFITIADIDTICNSNIVPASEVTY
ncbi:MAG: hypothetical protein J6R59_09780 [Paludibacteraceae bacterium]|nr:hypothetical protein [Paludibacteraceae bacterium]